MPRVQERVRRAGEHGWMVPAINVLLFRDALLEENVSEHEFFKNTGVSPRIVAGNDSLLTFDQATRCIANAARLTRNPGIGLRVGGAESPADWGTLGYAMLSCATVDELLNAILRFHQTAGSMVDVFFTREEDRARLELVPAQPLHEALSTVLEEHLAATRAALATLTGTEVPLTGVYLPYARPDYYRRYETLLRCPVYFDQPRCHLDFHAHFLETPVVRTNPFSAHLAAQICAEQMARQVRESEFTGQVRYLLLLQGNNFPSAEEVAGRLQITSRTLRNRLRDAGTSFQALLDDVRMQLAIDYLESSSMRVDEVAELLGFNDRSNFRRAFKGWTGSSPSEFRRQTG